MLAVSAASILAKYALDLYWKRVHEHYPEYDFINNAGYGVKAKEAIQKYGLIEGIHRKSYRPCKEYL
jgi:ribonuclease HII